MQIPGHLRGVRQPVGGLVWDQEWHDGLVSVVALAIYSAETAAFDAVLTADVIPEIKGHRGKDQPPGRAPHDQDSGSDKAGSQVEWMLNIGIGARNDQIGGFHQIPRAPQAYRLPQQHQRQAQKPETQRRLSEHQRHRQHPRRNPGAGAGLLYFPDQAPAHRNIP